MEDKSPFVVDFLQWDAAKKGKHHDNDAQTITDETLRVVVHRSIDQRRHRIDASNERFRHLHHHRRRDKPMALVDAPDENVEEIHG
jgi:hypothetical protein